MPTFGSLFSGIGGLDLGLERAGWDCKWQVEIDEWCRRVLARHWPDVPRYQDAKAFPPYLDANGERSHRAPINEQGRAERGRVEVRDKQIGELRSMGEPLGRYAVDLICGGFPCQPVSLAGKRLAQADERWLWPEFARIVRLLRPRYVLIENVPGLLAPVPVRNDGGSVIGWTAPPIKEVLRDLWACGFDVEWDLIPAAAVGAPHLRYRVFIVAYAARLSEEGPAEEPGAEWQRARQGGEPIPAPYAGGAGLEGRGVFGSTPDRGSRWWTTEPDVGRVAHGVPSRVDRLRGLGNAVVPQVAEWIGRRLMEGM